MKIGKLYRKIFKALIRGTVTSGHPTRTTFGNTLRVILFYKFMFMKAGIEHYRMYVGGDDFFAILLDADKERFRAVVATYISTR